jgi:ABC-type antimicrobial peptide transport system permease subunit
MALGASGRGIVAMVVRQGMRMALAGIILGAAGAVVLARVLESQLFQVPSFDPLTFSLMSAMALIVALLASLVPARRALSVEPLDACRHE